MKFVTIPRTELTVSQLCLGCWQFNDDLANINWSGQKFETSKSIFDEAVRLGINFFDTAEAYVNSEVVLGRCMEGKRRDYIVSSKIGYRANVPYKAEEIEVSITKSLQSLKTDYIDLYQIHWPVVVGDMNEFVTELKSQVARGRIRYIGVSNFGPKNMKAIVGAGCLPISNQLPYNLLTRGIEYDIQPRCEELGVSILGYSVMQQGLLTGKFLKAEDLPEGRKRTRHFAPTSSSLSRHGGSGFEKQTFQAVTDILQLSGGSHDVMSQNAIAWCLQRPMVKAVIVGASAPQQLKKNADIICLEQETISKLDEITRELKECLGSNVDLWAPESQPRVS